APGLQRDGALGLYDAERLTAAAVGGDPIADGLPGQVLVRAEVHLRPGLHVLVDALVEHDHRDLGVDGLLDHRDDGVGVGQCDGETVDLAVDRVLDQGGLLGSILVVGVLQIDVVFVGGFLGAGPDLVPERVTRLFVGDHGDGQGLAPAGGVLVSGTALAAAGGERGRGGQQRRRYGCAAQEPTG